MKTKITLVFISMLMVLSGCSIKDDRLFQGSNSDDKNTSVITDQKYQEEVKYEYKIATNDRVSITVYVQAGSGSQQMSSILASSDLTRGGVTNVDSPVGLLVTQQGNVRLPLVGSVKVTGLTEDQAAKVLIAAYKKYIRNPYVVVEITNQRIIVIGEVQKPGVIPIINGTMNLIEVISKTGYLTQNASRTNIKIIRGDLRHPEVRNIDLTDAKALLTTSLLLKPNDIVYVQARQMSGFNKAFQETAPFFQTVSTILNPFVQRTIIQAGPLR
ncbi:MAG: polysaccharide biosynthesis/export family protein [Sulfurimonas sp.]